MYILPIAAIVYTVVVWVVTPLVFLFRHAQ
jgi:hypothetical protein